MKRLLYLFAAMLVSVSMYAQNEPKMNDDNVLEYKEVFTAEGMSAENIFIAVHQMLSDWAYDKNSKNAIDYSDKESGTVISKSLAFLGFQKANIMYGWNVYANCNITVKAKDEKYQVTIKVPSVKYKWIGDSTEDDTPIADLYPVYKAKKNLVRHKKASETFVPTIPDVMKEICQTINKKIQKSNDDDDDF